ncbi:hypothetical protein D3C76_1151150 [compost metagenome]
MLAFQVRDIHQRRAVRYPELVGAAFAFSMLFNLTHVAAVFVNQPHAGIHQIVRAFMAERDGVVIKRTVDRVTEPVFLFVDHAAFAGLQIDAQQAAVRPFMEEVVEDFPVVQRGPVALRNFDTHQFGAVRVGHPGAVADPVVAHAIHFALNQRRQIDFQQGAIILNVIEGFIIRRQEAAKGVVARAFG